MNTASRVGAYLVGLGAVFGLALGVGALAGPVADEPAGHHTASDYRLQLRNPGLAAGPARPLVFTITDGDGAPVTRYDVNHDRRMHLIAVRHDFTSFEHVHPTLTADGTWSTTADLSTGRWRLYADFVPAGGENTVLSDDLEVTGSPAPAAVPGISREAHVDGYDVALHGDLVAGAHAELSFAVTRGGTAVRVQPYLGANGHLVALREDDRAYLHVHPDAGPGLRFGVEVPAADRYHLYLDFKIDGVVRTAQFALDATVSGADPGHDHGDDQGDDQGGEHTHD